MSDASEPFDGQWPSVGVIVPCYNAEKWVARAIQSALDQKYPNCEIIVVNDGSTDKSLEIIKAFGNKIKIESGPNRGGCAARNSGMFLARSQFLIFLDADDYIEGNLFEGLVNVAHRDSADVVFAPFTFEFEDGTRTRDRGLDVTNAETLIAGWLSGSWVPPCAILWRSDMLARIGGWNTSITRNQDGELVLRALCQGARYSTSNFGKGIYFQHDSHNRVSRRTSLTAFEDQLRIYALVERYARERGSLQLLRAVSQACYHLARDSYRKDYCEVAEGSLRKARALGLMGHPGSLPHWLFSSLIGLHRKERIGLVISDCLSHRMFRRYFRCPGLLENQQEEWLRRAKEESVGLDCRSSSLGPHSVPRSTHL